MLEHEALAVRADKFRKEYAYLDLRSPSRSAVQHLCKIRVNIPRDIHYICVQFALSEALFVEG